MPGLSKRTQLRALLAGIALLLPRSGHAFQTSAGLRIDNDFFNFWQPLAQRPDEEYTQGVQLTLRWSGTGFILPHLLSGLAACPNLPASDRVCGRLTLGLGQDMYTPAIDSRRLLPGQRPYAGWLYLEGTERAESLRRLDVLRLTIGITGPPSLAEGSQTLWHDWFGYRKPLGWAGQLPFEIDLGLSYQGARRLGGAGSSESHFILAAVWTANAGTILTGLELGVRATVGWRPPVPWGTSLRPYRSAPGLYLVAAVRGDALAHNLFLDGTTFRTSPKVDSKWLVGQLEAGLGASLGRVRLEWTVFHRGPEYRTQTRPHTYSRVSIGWE